MYRHNHMQLEAHEEYVSISGEGTLHSLHASTDDGAERQVLSTSSNILDTMTRQEDICEAGEELQEEGRPIPLRERAASWRWLFMPSRLPSQSMSVSRSRRLTQFCWKVFFLGIGLLLFSGSNQIATLLPLSGQQQQVSSGQSSTMMHYPGMGHGSSTSTQLERTQTTMPSSIPGCEDDIYKDQTCWVKNRINDVANWMAGGVYAPMKPFTEMFFNSPVNIIYATPKDLSYGNETVMKWTGNMKAVAAAAFSLLFVISVLSSLIGGHINLRSLKYNEAILRAAVAFVASQFSLYFVQLFIDCNNKLTFYLYSTVQLSFLKTIFVNGLTFQFLNNGWMLVVLFLMLGLMCLFIVWQMFVRIIFLMFLIVVAPLALLCFALPATEQWGKLWLSNFTTTVFVQFFQVTLIVLGCEVGTQILGDPTKISWFVPSSVSDVESFFGLVMAAVFFYLAIKLPGMFRDWIFSGTAAAAGNVPAGAVVGAGEAAAEDIGARVKASVMSAVKAAGILL